MKQPKTVIVFTGGGTAGHVTPNLAVIERLDPQKWDIHYIGTADGIERTLLCDVPCVTYHAIDAGKLRRYFSLKNFTDLFHILHAMAQCRALMKSLRPRVVFSKGGFVTVPVVLCAPRSCHVFVHESDYSPGLANRLATRRADTVCCAFADTAAHFAHGRAVHTGMPIRAALYAGDRQRGLDFCGFTGQKPVLLCVGGSLGAGVVNDTLRAALPLLLPAFDIVHLTGKNKADAALEREGYVQFEYIGGEMGDLLTAADIVLSRAGANAVFELLALKKPALLVPLTAASSRGDQLQNAEYMRRNGYAAVMAQEQLSPQSLCDALFRLYDNRAAFAAKMSAATADGTDETLRLITELL